ncbi:hypothetical protein EDD18DRAFT_1173210 [Armillaria luteobubalina]|uniref:RNase H type-1 domain-containing protein n=1 Tax=Armillaria luteobubalina TaxID=153913 RepID=A0AA39Q2C5_9AGAR|nr:hypothetical protein EDD18DRAFT_1173210 [Armillaria luteobubalina]
MLSESGNITKLSTPKMEPTTCATRRHRAFTFNKNLTDQGSIADAFRIFTEGKVCNELPPPKIEWETSDYGDPIDLPQTVYTDGGCTNNGDENAVASAGVWFGPNDARNEYSNKEGGRDTASNKE